MAPQAEHHAQRLPDVGVVFHHQDAPALAGAARGRLAALGRGRRARERQARFEERAFVQALAAGVCLEPVALAEQQELREARLADMIRQLAPNPVERRWLAPDQLRRPFEIKRVVEPGF